MKQFFRLCVIAMLTAAFCLSAVACGGPGSDPGASAGKKDEAGKTVIYINMPNGGLGTKWAEDAGARFAELNKEKSYATGKKGVTVKAVTSEDSGTLNSAKTSNIAIYDINGIYSVKALANSGNIACIDDLVKDKSEKRNGVPVSIEDKMREQDRNMFKAADGKYYAVPGCEFYGGMGFDKGLFDKHGFYFAKSDAGAVNFTSEILQKDFSFVGESQAAEKTCGPNGKAGDYDDGFPSSLTEMVALFEYMKSLDVTPIEYGGENTHYSNFMLNAIMSSLLGPEKAYAMFNMGADKEGGQEMEIVVGFENGPLFPGEPGILKPVTKRVNVTEEQGYYASWAVEKYYAMAFMELCRKRNWFGPQSDNGIQSQKDEYQTFVFNGLNENKELGLIIDGSFWYNEARISDTFESYDMFIAGRPDEEKLKKHFGWFPCPVTYDEQVTVDNGLGRGQTFYDIWSNVLVINKKFESNPEIFEAAKDFVAFLNTDAELSHYTKCVGINKAALSYDLTPEDEATLDEYSTMLRQMVDEGNVIYFVGNNRTFEQNLAAFSISWNNAMFSVQGIQQSYYKQRRDHVVKSCDDAFIRLGKTYEDYTKMYKGDGEVTMFESYDRIADPPSKAHWDK